MPLVLLSPASGGFKGREMRLVAHFPRISRFFYCRNRLSAYGIRFTSRCPTILHPNLRPNSPGHLCEGRKTGVRGMAKGESPIHCLLFSVGQGFFAGIAPRRMVYGLRVDLRQSFIQICARTVRGIFGEGRKTIQFAGKGQKNGENRAKFCKKGGKRIDKAKESC